jgi:hypothetical protein
VAGYHVPIHINRCQPIRINPIPRIIPHINIRIYPTLKSDGVGGQVSSGGRIIVAVVVVVQADFRVKNLAGEPEIVFNGINGDFNLTEGQIIGRPDDSTRSIG